MRILDAYSGVVSLGDTIPAISRSYAGKSKVGVAQGVMQVTSRSQQIGAAGGSATDPLNLVVIMFGAVSSNGGAVNIGSMNFATNGPARTSQNPAINWTQTGYSYLMVDLSGFD